MDILSQFVILNVVRDLMRKAKRQYRVKKIFRYAQYDKVKKGCHAEPVEAWWAMASARVLRQAQDDSRTSKKQIYHGSLVEA